MSKLKLEDLFNIQNGNIVFSLDKNIKIRLKKYSYIVERLENSIYFANKIRYNNREEKGRAEGFLRASLCEFISIEDILSIYEINLKIYKTKHPLLIILKLIRNLDIHIETNEIECNKQNMLWNEKEISFKMIFINNLTIDKLKKTKTVKHYSLSDLQDLEESLIWFEKNCKEWGINEMILRAVNIYAKLIIKEIS